LNKEAVRILWFSFYAVLTITAACTSNKDLYVSDRNTLNNKGMRRNVKVVKYTVASIL